MSMRCLHLGRRAAVIAVMSVVQLADAGFAIGVAAGAPGFTPVVTVSVDGATGTWAPAGSAAAEPSASVLPDTATTPPGPPSDQSVGPITPATPEAT